MDSFKIWLNTVRSLIRNAKREYYTNYNTQIKNTTDIWKYMEELNPKTEMCYRLIIKRLELPRLYNYM